MTKLGVIKLAAEAGWNALLLFLLPFAPELDLKLLLVYVIINLLCGRYRHKALLIWDEVRFVVQAYLGSFFIDLLLIPVSLYSWSVFWRLIAYFILSFLGILVINRFVHLIFWNMAKDNVLIIGTGPTAVDVYNVCAHNRFSLLNVCGFVQFHAGDEDDIPEDIRKKVPIYPFADLEAIIKEKKITVVLVAVRGVPTKVMRRLLSRINRSVDKIKYVPVLEEQINFSSTIEDFDGQLMISTSTGKITWPEKVFKRAVDLVASIPGLLILGPMTLYVWYVNRKYNNEGPIFFKQKRIGKDGKLFTIYKYRSMIMNADEALEKLLASDPKLREEYEKNKKLDNDPRIIPAWDRLRRKNVDEFPQFINVFKGDMSLIGPRPYLPREKEDMGDMYEEIIQLKPGITGMWQTHGRSSVDFEKRLDLDSYYYHNWSTWLDLTLLVRTFKMLLNHEDSDAK